MKSDTFYSLNKILKEQATYNIIFGERSNGKTYSVLKYAIQRYFETDGKEQIAIVRRYSEDIRGTRAQEIFTALLNNNEVYELSGGVYSSIWYWNRKFYFCNYDESGKRIYCDEDVLGHTFALSESEHNKSISYPKVTTILFDEFITNRGYLADEFVLFMNTVSTIIRQRTNVKIFMLGNTISKYCPYFKEMGLQHVSNMKQGEICVYTYGSSELKVAVEYCSSLKSKKKNNYYFAFDNPKLNMITNGAWELDMYPHLPFKYVPNDIRYLYFIIFNDIIYQCEIICKDRNYITYIHVKTTPIKDDRHYVYTLEYSPKMNYSRNILKPINEVQKKIAWFFNVDKVFYQDNEVGDAINNYLEICKRGKMK